MIRKTYIPGKPRSPKLVPSTQKSYDRIISSLSEQVNKPQPKTDPRVSELKSYLEVVNTDLARLNGTYNTINDSTVIGLTVKTQLIGLKDNLDASAGAFISYANGALADGVLTEEEIEEIDTRKEAYLTAFGSFMAFAEPISISLITVNILKDDLEKYAREKAQIDSVYPGLHGHTYLTGGTKTAYAAAKTTYDSAYSDLVNTIDSYIFDGMVTPSESDQIQYYVGIYNTKIAEYKQAEENVKNIISLVTGYYEKLRTYAADKSRADNVYLLVYNNIYLVGADKTAYASAKTAYDTAYTDVVSGIDTIISTGTLTPSEISAVSDLIDEYLSKLSLLIAAEETAREAIGEEQKRQAQVYAESLFDDVVETQTALENSLLKYSESINPITAQMMQLIVGDESLQFHFVESKVNPVRVSHSISYLSGTLTVYAGWIKHLTLGITDISPAHEYKFWNVPLSAFGSLDPDKYYYLYAKCSTSAETGEYILSETPVEIDGVSGYYHLLMGILNSENNSTRRFAQLYGFTEILPGRITTDKIVSQDGQTYFDLITALLSIGNGKIVLDGSDGSGHLANGNISWDDAGNVELSGKIASGGGISTIGDEIKLNADGSGQLASGNISWDEDGNVEVSGKIDATEGELGSLTMKSGGYIDLPPTFTSRKGRLDNKGLSLIYQGNDSQIIEWYNYLGTFAGRITCDSSGKLKLLSSYGIRLGIDTVLKDAITITEGSSLNHSVNMNGSDVSNLKKLSGVGVLNLSHTTHVINANTNYHISNDTTLIILTSVGDGGSIYRITGSGGASPNNGDVRIIMNTSSEHYCILKSNVTNSNIKVLVNGGPWFRILQNSIVVMVYYDGYWRIQTDWGQPG